MVKSQREVNWKSLSVDEDLAPLGLVAIEECVDYNVDTLRATKSPKRKPGRFVEIEPKKKKRKVAKAEVVKSVISPSKTGSSVKSTTTKEVCEDGSPMLLVWNGYGVPNEIAKGLTDQGFTEPTQIQSLTLAAAILGRRDIIGAAETGSGKTLAFGLPILTGIYNSKQTAVDPTLKPLYALILTPTRELAIQIRNHLVAAAKHIDVNVAVIVGGMAAVKQERILSKGPEIVVATPGRLWELIQQGNAHLSQIDNIQYLVIDETDRMLERGHFEELHNLLERLNEHEDQKKLRQNFVFSATLTLVHELPKYLTSKVKRSKLRKLTPEQKLQQIISVLGISNPKIVDVTQGNGTSKTLTESRITCAIDEKDYYVYYFLQRHPGRTLIFCNSIGCVKRLTNLMMVLGCKPLPIHASMQQRQRLKNLERFRDNDNSILVATDVAARGLDIPKVEHVLHYQTPRTSESYVHRSGRTARASQQGITILLIEPSEIPNYIKLCRTLKKSEDLPTFPIEEDQLNAVKERVNLARDLDKLDLDIRKGNAELGWFQKAAEDMDIIVDDMDKKYDRSEIQQKKKSAEMKRKHLGSLVAKPIFQSSFLSSFPSYMDAEENVREEAVQLVKNAVEKAKTEKRKVRIFKPKKIEKTLKPKAKKTQFKRK